MVETWFAPAHLMPPPDYLAAAGARLKSLLGAPDVRVRMPVESFEAMVLDEDQRYRTQFESKRSRGILDQQLRAALEAELFGLPENLTPELRPVYGYLGGSNEELFVWGYGEVVLLLADEVRARTTFTCGDSLMETDAATRPRMAPALLLEPDLLAAGADRDPLQADELLDLTNAAHQFVEAQIFGQVRLDDLREVVYTLDTQPSNAVRRVLNDRRIQVKQTSGDDPCL